MLILIVYRFLDASELPQMKSRKGSRKKAKTSPKSDVLPGGGRGGQAPSAGPSGISGKNTTPQPDMSKPRTGLGARPDTLKPQTVIGAREAPQHISVGQEMSARSGVEGRRYHQVPPPNVATARVPPPSSHHRSVPQPPVSKTK